MYVGNIAKLYLPSTLVEAELSVTTAHIQKHQKVKIHHISECKHFKFIQITKSQK